MTTAKRGDVGVDRIVAPMETVVVVGGGGGNGQIGHFKFEIQQAGQ